MELVTSDDVISLLDHLAKNPFRVRDQDSKAEETLKKCKDLFAKDYKYTVINNQGGELVATYPSELIIPQKTICGCYENTKSDSLNCSDIFCDTAKLRELMVKARVARCRARFPIPVIFCNGKYICRSATLSGGYEIYTRSGYDFFFAGNNEVVSDDEDLKEMAIPQSSSEWQLFTKVRTQDIRLLKALSVGYICDLMVEKKKVKFGMNVTSSEKVDKENRYGEFIILSLPYPGCEFFKDYRDNSYNAEGLVFDWNQAFVDAQIGVPSDFINVQLEINWDNYKSWDLVRLTQNYLKLQLKYLVEGNSGLLVHCISGWDRTPLFVSLLRLSLWADGKAHASLNPLEITYLTIAYDWYLFGHDLPDRLSKGEEIFYFCFYFLKYLVPEEFSSHNLKSKNNQRNGSDCQLDGILLEEDPLKIIGNGSSLSSSCSSVSSRSQDNNPPQYFTNGVNGASTAPTQDIWDEVTLHSNGNLPTGQSLVWPSYYQPYNCSRSGSTAKMADSDSLGNGSFPPSTPPTLTNSSSSEAGVNAFNGNDTPVRLPSPAPYSLVTPLTVPLAALHQGNRSNPFSPHAVATMALSSPSSSSCSPVARLSPAIPISGITGCSTSPVAVPNSLRQRSESSSSTGCGSWQIISGTGSVRGSSSTRSSLSSPTLELNHNSSGNSKNSLCHDSGEYQTEHLPLCSSWSRAGSKELRQERLDAVRTIFYHAYTKAIGFKFRNGSNENRGLGTLLDHFAEKVGFRSAKTTTV